MISLSKSQRLVFENKRSMIDASNARLLVRKPVIEVACASNDPDVQNAIDVLAKATAVAKSLASDEDLAELKHIHSSLDKMQASQAALVQAVETIDNEQKRQNEIIQSLAMQAFPLENAWVELVPPMYPEGDYVGVFCAKCGNKNRQDAGWRYRDDPKQRATQEAEFRRMGSSMEEVQRLLRMMQPPGITSRLAKLHYQCDDCRDDKPVDAGDEDDDDDEDEDDEGK